MSTRDGQKDRRAKEVEWTWISNELFFGDDDLPGEIWTDFTEYNGKSLASVYQASNKGRVRRKGEHISSGVVSYDGYHEVSIGTSRARVHQVILRVFQGPPPKDMDNPTVQHINHDKLDNRIENLCWMSAFDNNQEGHGVRCKIVDKYGEHIFPSQKFASKYIGRHDDYISEGIGYNYKMTTAQGEPFEVYTEVKGKWVKYKRCMLNNRRWCRLIKDKQVIDFDSFQQCSNFLNLPIETVGHCVANSWPIPICEDIEFYIYDRVSQDYIKYIPTKQKNSNGGRKCVITDKMGIHEFSSISKAALYLGRDSEWLRLAIRDNKPVKNHDGVLVQAYCLDPEGRNFDT